MSSFEEHVQRQHPFRPSHPDFELLRQVVDIVEGHKVDRRKAEQVYGQFIDIVSASYVAANRSGMTLQKEGAGIPSHLHERIVELMTNAWMEGLFFGVNFQLLGGHRNEDGTTTVPETPNG